MRDLFGLPRSVGAVIGSQHVMSRALEAPFDEAHAYAKRQPVKHADETGWWQQNGRAWLWTVVTPLVTVFLVRAQRSSEVARALLGKVTGGLVADWYKAYRYWPADAYQFGWAHLVRDFVARTEREAASRGVGEALLDEARTMFAWWHRVCEGRLTRFFFQIHLGPVRRRVEALLAEGAALTHPKSAGLCRSLLERAPALWTFVAIEGVAPTNHSGERSVRHGVLWRSVNAYSTRAITR